MSTRFAGVDWARAALATGNTVDGLPEAGCGCSGAGGAGSGNRSERRARRSERRRGGGPSAGSAAPKPAIGAGPAAFAPGVGVGAPGPRTNALCPDDLGYGVSEGAHEVDWVSCSCSILVDAKDSQRDPTGNETLEIKGEYSFDATETGAAINGVEVSTDTSSGDPANAAHEDIWFTVPPDLADYWSTNFPFGDPALHWVYARVASGAASHCVGSAFDMDFTYATQGAHVVCGLRPYVAYKILSRARSPVARSWRVRVWVGLMHHFSFFIPPSTWWDHSSRWGTGVVDGYTDDSGAQMWDATTGKVDERGTFADMFTSLTDGLAFTTWFVPVGRGSDAYLPNVYSCDPTENLDISSAYWSDTYQEKDGGGALLGTPAPIAYSDPYAKDSATSTTMTSFLGTAAEGDVCILAAPDSGFFTNAQIAKKAFEMMFGEYAIVAFQLSGQGFAASSPEFTVNRWFRLEADDLEPVDDLVAELDALRGTAEGRYVIRDFDLRRLEASAAAGMGLRDCGCV